MEKEGEKDNEKEKQHTVIYTGQLAILIAETAPTMQALALYIHC